MAKRWKIVAVACAFFVAAGVALTATVCFLHEPAKGEGDASKEQREPHVAARLLSPSIVLAFCGLLGQVKPSANADKPPASPEPPKWTDTVQAVSAGLVAALTIVLLIITGKQFDLLTRSTQAAENAIRIARETAAAQLRAYVTLATIDINHVEADGAVIGVSFIPMWKNSGTTPDRNVQYYTVCDFSFSSEPRDPAFPILGISENRTVIGPGMEEVGPATRDITDQEFRDFAANKVFVCLYGAVSYTDFSGKMHRTEFCTMTDFGSDFKGSRSMRFSKTLAHNGADEDCMRAPYAKPDDPLRLRA